MRKHCEMTSRLLLAAALPVLTVLFAIAAAQAKVYAGPRTGAFYEEAGPRLMAALIPWNRSGLDSGGGPRTPERVRADPDALPVWATLKESLRERAREALNGLETADPLEPVNRLTYAFNELVEVYALDPFYRFYIDKVPRTVRRGVSNVFRNLHEPITAVSALLEGNLENAGVASLRFAVNSTAGVLGTMDVAADLDLVSRRTDLGATFCRYGVPSGPYLVLPILGPSSPRELTGRVLTNITIYGFIGGLFYPYYSSRLLVEYIDDRPGLDWAMEGAVDSYARQRAIFRQYEAGLCGEMWVGDGGAFQ